MAASGIEAVAKTRKSAIIMEKIVLPSCVFSPFLADSKIAFTIISTSGAPVIPPFAV